VGVHEFQGLARSGDSGPGLGVEAEAHGKSFRIKPYLLE
jgi:hypothetical protein